MSEQFTVQDGPRVLGVVFFAVDFAAIADRALALRPGEMLQLRPEEAPRSAPILEVSDDSWRSDIQA